MKRREQRHGRPIGENKREQGYNIGGNKGTRADDKNHLQVPKVKKSTFGGRSFSFVSASLWNQLPDDLHFETNIESLKKQLR